MKKVILITCCLFLISILHAQDKFFTKTGQLHFDATTKSSPTTIEGKHKSVVAVLDIKTGNLQFSILMKSFLFKQALMEEHFNENYVESDKYPKCEFKGLVLNNVDVNYTKDGSYNAKVKGTLMMHGVTKEIETTGKVIIKEGKPQLKAIFSITLTDYNISIPNLVSDEISRVATIDLDCNLEPLKK